MECNDYFEGRRGMVGLVNLGSTCFLNSTIQCLFRLEKFKELLLCDWEAVYSSQNTNMIGVTSATFKAMASKLRPFACNDFLAAVQTQWASYDGGEQDALEFLSFLLCALHEDLKESSEVFTSEQEDLPFTLLAQKGWDRRSRSPINLLFGIQLIMQTKCGGTCSYSSLNFENNIFLSVDMPSKDSLTLQDCLQDLVRTKDIPDACCSWCFEKECLHQGTLIGRLPPYLIIHLKRFRQQPNGQFILKDCFVQFGGLLDMNDYVIGGLQSRTEYELVGVVNHFGSLDGGHYTAYCKGKNSWYEFNDTKVSNVTYRKVVSKNAYLLFYQLKQKDCSCSLPFDTYSTLPELCLHMHTDSPEKDISPLVKRSVLASAGVVGNQEKLKNTVPRKSAPTGTTTVKAPDKPDYSTMDDQPERTVRQVFLSNGDVLNKDVNNTRAAVKRATHVLDIKAIAQSKVVQATRPTDVRDTKAIAQSKVEALPPPSVSATISLMSGYQPRKEEGIHDKSRRTCMHRQPTIDIDDPLLEPQDVDGADIDVSNLERYRLGHLQRWLATRKLPRQGTRAELIERIQNCVQMGRQDRIDPAVDGGKWHELKRKALLKGIETAVDAIPSLPNRPEAWNPFPSSHIPEGYSRESLLIYFKSIPHVVLDGGIVKAGPATLNSSFHENSSEEDVSDSDDDQQYDFIHLCRRAVMRCISKGEVFLSSGRVLAILDCQEGRHWFVKAQVQASMEHKLYMVHLIFNRFDGTICEAGCGCKARALRRCGHIAAVALLILHHVNTLGREAVTTTGRQCYWRKAAKPKDPGFISQKQYPAKKKLNPRVSFVPIATRFYEPGLISAARLQEFKRLLRSRSTSLHAYHVLSFVMEEPHLESDGEQKVDIQEANHEIRSERVHLEQVQDLLPPEETAAECSRILWELNMQCSNRSTPFELPHTFQQAGSSAWYEERAKICTASAAKTILGLTSDKAKTNFLRKHVWRLDRFESAAMTYGKKHEDTARNQYLAHLRLRHPDVKILQTGLCVNPKYPQLACSPDGLIQLHICPDILLEIKVLTKTYINPEKFEEHMTDKERRTFYLNRRTEDNDLLLLKPHHQYYYQIQMSLSVLELEWAHLLVWSESGYVVVPVQYDATFWHEKQQRLIMIHRELIVPEMVLQRTKRHLPPRELVYTPFHEAAEDMYFAERSRHADKVHWM